MSFTDDSTDQVQPDGQGEAGTDAPYAEYLSRIPEEVRGDVEPVFKEWDQNVGKKFQEHSDFRKQWEPLAQTGVNNLSPDEVSWLVQFRQAMENPESIQQWYEGFAEQNGLTPAQAQQQQQDLGTFDEYDPSKQFEALLDQRLAPIIKQYEQLQNGVQQQTQAQAQAEADRYIEGQLAQLNEKHGGDVNREVVEAFAAKYVESDPMNAINRGYDDMVKFTNGIEKNALQAKVDSPDPALGGGVPDVNAQQPKNFRDAEEVAKEYLRNMRN